MIPTSTNMRIVIAEDRAFVIADHELSERSDAKQCQDA